MIVFQYDYDYITGYYPVSKKYINQLTFPG
jgi:hypothetical protein